MNTRRLDQINQTLKNELAWIIAILVDPRQLGMVTVKRAQVTKDLRQAKVWISLRPDTEANRQLLHNLLTNHRLDIQERIAKRLPIKFTPRLEFVDDFSENDVERLEQLIAQIKT